MYKRFIILFFIVFFVFVNSKNVKAQNKRKFSKAFDFNISYTGDLVYNFDGGIKTGGTYMGLLNLNLGFDTKKAGLWNNGYFFSMLSDTHGRSLSENYIGDFQVSSNIDGGNNLYIQELWYSHTLDQFSFILGIQDLNVEFANSNFGGLFINSSFGIMPTLATNANAPIFPLTTLGFTVKWDINKNWIWKNAIYDGQPFDNGDKFLNFEWDSNDKDGGLFISEMQYNFDNKTEYSSGIKVGTYLHHKQISAINNDGVIVDKYINGIYSIMDLHLWNSEKNSLDAFTQVGFSPSKNIEVDYYLGGGINYTGLFNHKGRDVVGIAVNVLHFNILDDNETVAELTYQYNFSSKIYLQPDFQYIINPMGTDINLNNSFVGFLRFGFNF